MAISFSNVKLASGDKVSTFLISGTPTDASFFTGWTKYHSFINDLVPYSYVVALVTSYLYGEEDIVEATPEEVAYMTVRLEKQPDFLESRCKQVDQIKFSFTI